METDFFQKWTDVTQKKPLNNSGEQAVGERLLLANPAKGCRLPKLEKREMKILPEDKIGPYLAEAERRGLLAAFYLELTTGLRRGELLALLWTDLDVENMTISVSKQVNRINGELVVSQPKTPNSIRKLPIPQRAMELLVEEHASTHTVLTCLCRPRPAPCSTRTSSATPMRRSWRPSARSTSGFMTSDTRMSSTRQKFLACA